jgi:hypothetical protein
MHMKASELNPLRRTFGYFVRGIPVVFLKNDILFRDRDASDDYFRLVADDGGGRPDAPFDHAAAAAFERFATLFHELKHFHDALLCRPLFEQFLRQNKLTWAVMQIISRLAKRRHLPSSVNDPIWKTDPELALLKRITDDADEDSYNRSPGLYTRAMIERQEIGLDHLLEASAMTTELLHLYAVHGVDAMKRYHAQVVTNTEPLYRFLLEHFVTLFDSDLVRGTDALYCVLGISLYSSVDPVTRLVLLYEALKKDRTILGTEVATWLANSFPAEDDFAKRVYSDWLVDAASNEPLEPSLLENHEFPIDELAYLHHTLYRARRKLIRDYVKRAQYRADFYVEHLHEFGAPPILFYPLDVDSAATQAKAMLQRELHTRGIDHFIIAGVNDEEQGMLVLGGLCHFPETRSLVSFDVADQILFANFCHRYLFEGTEQLYGPLIDEMYLRTLRNFVLGASPK